MKSNGTWGLNYNEAKQSRVERWSPMLLFFCGAAFCVSPLGRAVLGDAAVPSIFGVVLPSPDSFTQEKNRTVKNKSKSKSKSGPPIRLQGVSASFPRPLWVVVLGLILVVVLLSPLLLQVVLFSSSPPLGCGVFSSISHNIFPLNSTGVTK